MKTKGNMNETVYELIEVAVSGIFLEKIIVFKKKTNRNVRYNITTGGTLKKK